MLSGQRWIATFAHTGTLVCLPIITFVITKVISGNIALSLGMVGALSIVRFRHPVRSPFELSIYFASITMGISASVSLGWLMFLVGSIVLALMAIFGWAEIFKWLTGKQYFETSFSEGNRMSTLEIKARQPIKQVQESSFIISESKVNNSYTYILATDDFAKLRLLSRTVQENPDILEVHLSGA
mgnify:CR=1 FL=1